MRYVKIGLILMVFAAMLLAGCQAATPAPGCDGCHASEPSPVSSCDYLKEGFTPVESITAMKEGKVIDTLRWDPKTATLSNGAGISISVPEGQKVTPIWPDPFAANRGTALANCQGRLYSK